PPLPTHYSLLLHRPAAPRALHSFPTRRSSDLLPDGAGQVARGEHRRGGAAGRPHEVASREPAGLCGFVGRRCSVIIVPLGAHALPPASEMRIGNGGRSEWRNFGPPTGGCQPRPRYSPPPRGARHPVPP